MNSAAYDSHSSSAKPDVLTLRVLCLGNELLGDDALGCVVEDQLRQFPVSGRGYLFYAGKWSSSIGSRIGSATPGRG